MSLANTQISRLHKAFANNSSGNIRLSKTYLYKIVQSGVFAGILLGPLLKIRLSLIENVLKQLAKRVLTSLRLTATETATDSTIHKNVFGSVARPSDLSKRETLTISNEEMNDIMKIKNSCKESILKDNRRLWNKWKWSKEQKNMISKNVIKYIMC